MSRPSLADLLAPGPAVLDGAMGTELGARGVPTEGALWSALAPLDASEAVMAVHADYLRAGAQVILTDSYQATVPGFEAAGQPGARALEAVAASVRIARQAADGAEADTGRRALVAGSIGPYGAMLADGSEYTGDYHPTTAQLEAVHRPRLEVLSSEGVDVLALETMPRLDEVQSVLGLIGTIAPDAECWVSFQVRPGGDALADGTPLERAAAWADAEPRVVAVGLNCVAPETVEPALAILAGATAKPLVAYPNSGDIWDAATRTWIPAAHEQRFTASAPRWLDQGARLIGGCCRTTPADTSALAAMLAA